MLGHCRQDNGGAQCLDRDHGITIEISPGEDTIAGF